VWVDPGGKTGFRVLLLGDRIAGYERYMSGEDTFTDETLGCRVASIMGYVVE
jgi:hypothetical protein